MYFGKKEEGKKKREYIGVQFFYEIKEIQIFFKLCLYFCTHMLQVPAIMWRHIQY